MTYTDLLSDRAVINCRWTSYREGDDPSESPPLSEDILRAILGRSKDRDQYYVFNLHGGLSDGSSWFLSGEFGTHHDAIRMFTAKPSCCKHVRIRIDQLSHVFDLCDEYWSPTSMVFRSDELLDLIGSSERDPDFGWMTLLGEIPDDISVDGMLVRPSCHGHIVLEVPEALIGSTSKEAVTLLSSIAHRLASRDAIPWSRPVRTMTLEEFRNMGNET